MPFFVTIQNQFSVLNKILATKVQHQQQIEKQQQAIVTQNNKVTTPLPSRSRKTSSNHDSASHTSSHRDRLGSVSSVAPPADRKQTKQGETAAISGSGEKNLHIHEIEKNLAVADAVSEGTSCVIS